ncbi:glycoside hydrolase family 99-like domain-containing protein [Paraburkholderia fungorum]|uniref:Glycoside hydrolase family 99-like domain-containing protein n=1 Tax=Paraburkholderia fungorum TaxID=134537 RepID=A0AAP5UVG7_9BURK|nr:glycoside hydrolase family 99-like domain-containing protein [Paraburkholderia fungorum]MDT8838257.1 glycoside hydrolase family 99-like domain-containing protein [Paraburkholderia fungorum]PRZ51903.1 glycosyl transferase family WbsX [Paraburkholderia fungorum]
MRFAKISILAFLAISLAAFNRQCEAGADASAHGKYTVGVYYFPGWRISPPMFHNDPWTKIKDFPEREPAIGWYVDGDTAVTDWQNSKMASAGINLVVYDWYWLPKIGVELDHAIESFRKLDNKRGVKYALLWANHSGAPSSEEEFANIVNFWISHYFSDAEYYKISGYPVVVIFAPVQLDSMAKTMGKSSKQLLDEADQWAKKAGFPGIYFVASTQAVPGRVDKMLPQAGYRALTAYNYQNGPTGTDGVPRESRSYSELAAGYRESWEWILKNSPIPYWIPVTSGWDKRPWGGSDNSFHDRSTSSPQQFRQHLLEARGLVDVNSTKTNSTVLICCWNEFGEGSYIEPTKKFGEEYIDAVRDVFNK